MVYWVFLVILLIVVGTVLYRSMCDELYFHYKDYSGGYYFDKNYNTANAIPNLTPVSYLLLNALDQVDCDTQKDIKSLLSEHNSDLILQAQYKKLVNEFKGKDELGDGDEELGDEVGWEKYNMDAVSELVFASPELKLSLSKMPLYKLNNVITSNKSTYYWVQILSRLLNCTPKNYILVLSDHKKQFNDLGTGNKRGNSNEWGSLNTKLTKESINSAEFHKLTETLYVYRKEEFIKTLIHELIHCSKKESWLYSVNFTLPVFTASVNTNSTLLLTEAATEALAQFINVMICSTDNHNFNYLWEKEITFGLYQTAKILYLSSISDISDFLSGKCMVTQETAAIEYHMISTIFMIHFNEFYKAFTTQNKSKILGILNYINDKKYKEIINKFIYDFSIGYQINTNLYKTSRMSVTEMIIG